MSSVRGVGRVSARSRVAVARRHAPHRAPERHSEAVLLAHARGPRSDRAQPVRAPDLLIAARVPARVHVEVVAAEVLRLGRLGEHEVLGVALREQRLVEIPEAVVDAEAVGRQVLAAEFADAEVVIVVVEFVPVDGRVVPFGRSAASRFRVPAIGVVRALPAAVHGLKPGLTKRIGLSGPESGRALGVPVLPLARTREAEHRRRAALKRLHQRPFHRIRVVLGEQERRVAATPDPALGAPRGGLDRLLEPSGEG